MIPSWYNTEERIASLQAVALSWVGTPWAQNSCVKGPYGGVSCHKQPPAILRESGFPFDLDIPDGPPNWSMHNEGSLIADFMDARPEFASVELPEDLRPPLSGPWPLAALLQPGDVLGLHVGKGVHHACLMLPGLRFIHVWRGPGVLVSELGDSTYLKRLKRAWRPLP